VSDPLIDVLTAELVPEGRGFALPPKGQAVLAEALSLRFGKPDLRDGVRALLLFAFFLDQRKQSPGAARAIISVLSAAKEAMAASQIQLDAMVRAIDAEPRQFPVPAPSEPSPAVPGAPILKWWEAQKK
jgi:hypothetical protein